MNFLAHLFLSEGPPAWQLGNFLGDFTKGRIEDYPLELGPGIRFHRLVDREVDRHPVLGHSQHLVAPERRRWAGVISDLVWDHFLARHWTQFHAGSLEHFCGRFHQRLMKYPEWHFGRLAEIAPALTSQAWMLQYAELSGMRRAFFGLSQRSGRTLPLRGGILDLSANYAEWEARFLHGFPDLLARLRPLRPRHM